MGFVFNQAILSLKLKWMNYTFAFMESWGCQMELLINVLADQTLLFRKYAILLEL